MVAEYRDRIEKIFSDVAPEHRFWLVKGGEVKNLEELTSALVTMEDATFKHHVTEERNDFSEWIKNIIQDTELAETLTKIKTRESTLKAIELRIESLKNLKSIHDAIDKVREGIETEKEKVVEEKKAIEEADKITETKPASTENDLSTYNYLRYKKPSMFSDINLYVGLLVGFVLGVLLGFLM
jgi:hypothetical protein